MDGRLMPLDQRREGGVIAVAGPGDEGSVLHARYRHEPRNRGWDGGDEPAS